MPHFAPRLPSAYRIRQRSTSVFYRRAYATCHHESKEALPSSFIDSLLVERLGQHTHHRRGKRRFATPKVIDEDLVDGPPIALFSDPSAIPASPGNIYLQPDSVEYVGSYNWVDLRMPTIIVPGSPRIYRDDAPPYSVPLHRGGSIMDENGHRMRTRALVPVLAAVDATAAISGYAPLNWHQVDLITDRGNLRRLLTFLSGRWEPAEFRIDVQLAGTRTLLFTRWERKTESYCGKNNCYAHSFEVARTQPLPGCEYGLSHHRIITYAFDGLKTVVFLIAAPTCHVPFFADRTRGTDYIAAGLARAKDIEEVVHRVGQRVPPALPLADAPAGSRRALVHGKFHRTREETLESAGAQNRLIRQEIDYRRLGPLVRAIRDVVVARGRDARLSLIGVRGRGLEIRERKSSRSCLPERLLCRFDAAT
ncbi:hypothetical protein NM688_g5184 [Phlebia brevispora]|uniref:Uncharacterized protein n=1 Tax=Phlebia brevispora TaxID=194682 RepID=A0ACC1SZ75_9APHY|nr:hypothetical protein NM688_g5184 [Phlebia brevispora]